MRNLLLKLYSLITNYRFHKALTKPLALPSFNSNLQVEEIRAKATASLTSVSAFLAFSVAVLPLVAWREFDSLFKLKSQESLHSIIFWTLVAFLLPYLSFWFERYISAASVEGGSQQVRKQKRFRRSVLLILWLVLSVCLFVALPLLCPILQQALTHSFLLAGAVMIVLSVVFFLFALEFYDSASGWRGEPALHFHLAAIASNSFLFGVSLVLVGSALTVCALNFDIGRVLAASTLVVLIAMTEIERAVWDLGKEDTNVTSSLNKS